MHPESTRAPEGEREPFSFAIIRNPDVRQLLRDRVRDLVGLARTGDVDAFVFLDKSARPISWLFRNVWKRECPTLPVPDIRFVNIGRLEEPHLPEYPRVQRKTFGASAVRSVRETFGSQFDGRSVAVVDEIIVSGDTLRSAVSVFQEAFPRATFLPVFVTTVREIGTLPWADIPGASSVLELDEAVFAHPLNARTVERARLALREKFEDAMTPESKEELLGLIREGAEEIHRSMHDLFASVGRLAPDEVPAPVRLILEELRAVYRSAASESDVLRAEMPATDVIAATAGAAEIARDALLEINELLLRKGVAAERVPSMRALARATSRAASALRAPYDGQGINAEAVRFAAQSMRYRDASVLSRVGNQLRAEMREIAMLPASDA